MNMNTNTIDRRTFLQNLRISKLLSEQQYRLVLDKLEHIDSPREIAKALASWKLITKFHAKMLLSGKNYGFFLGPYLILDILGQGGMGRVYKAMHLTMNRVVALKVLAPRVVKTQRAQALFMAEVQASAQLNHPNIVMAFDANVVQGRHFLALEYVDGPNLEQHVRKHGPLAIGMACEIIFQAANGLQHAHEKGMVHRDIKPANLLYQKLADNTIQVKILDFGLARFHGAKEDAATPNTVAGTPDFLCPEQANGMQEVDIRGDLYSLGCTFYYLLTGKPPFAEGSVIDKLLRHRTEPPPNVQTLRPGVPPELSVLIRKMMAKDPKDRYQTPDELMEALAPYAAPTVMDWPIAPHPDRSSDPDSYVTPAESAQADTDPKAQASTQIDDEESILEWVDVNRMERQRQRWRRWVMTAVIIATGLLLIGAGALLNWVRGML